MNPENGNALTVNGDQAAQFGDKRSCSSMRNVPWQIWVVVALLSLEGIGDLIAVYEYPYAITWIAAKCLFVVGLIKGWKWVFGLFLVIAAVHVLYFLFLSPIASFLNLVLIILVCSSYRYFFPAPIRSDVI